MDSVLEYDRAALPMDSVLANSVDPEAQAIALAAQHHDADAQAILKTALSLYDGRIALVSSFGAESAALLHMVAEIDRSTPVIFLDTGRLFSQTLLYRNELARLLHKVDDQCDAHHETHSIIRISAGRSCHSRRNSDDEQELTRGPLSDDHLPYPTRHQRSSISRC